MLKFVALLILTISFFLSTFGFEGFVSAHGGCADATTLSAASTDCACDHIGSLPVSEADPSGPHPCHIGHCSFTLRAFSTAIAASTLLGTQPGLIFLRHEGGFHSDTLRPPARRFDILTAPGLV